MDNNEALSRFYSAFRGQVLIKAAEEGNDWMVYLQASNEGLDQDEEVMVSGALKKAADYFLGHGVITWDHKLRQLNDPLYHIGEPVDVAFNDDGETLVKARLYQKNRIAKSVWNNIQSGAKKLGASVGGGILKKSTDGVTKLLRVIWDETAITHKPVNDGTYGHVQMIPFTEFAKALTAGGGVNAADYTGGRALTAEDMGDKLASTIMEDGDDLPASYRELRAIFSQLFLLMIVGKIRSMADVQRFVREHGYNEDTANRIYGFVQSKLLEIQKQESAEAL